MKTKHMNLNTRHTGVRIRQICGSVTVAAGMVAITACNNSAPASSDSLSDWAASKQGHELRDSKTWGNVVGKNLEVEPFSNISVSEGTVDITFVQSDSTFVELCGNENVVRAYDFSVADGTLTIRYAASAGNTSRMPVLYAHIGAPAIENITLNGAGDFDVEGDVSQEQPLSVAVAGAGDWEMDGHLTVSDLRIEATGAGDVEMGRVSAATGNIRLSGAGDVKLKKLTTTGNVQVSLNGAGDVNAKIRCQDLSVQASGAGSADLNVKCDVLTASATGTGDVELEGTTRRLVRSSSGFGDLDTKKLSVAEMVTQ